MRIKYLVIIFSILISSPVSATDWYVDNAATGSNNGTSWTHAWESFADITWGVGGVVAGDTLYISGGASSKTYNERIVVGASGTEGNYITIKTGQDTGHNGTVILGTMAGGGYHCIKIENREYVKVSGRVGTGSDTKMQLTGNTDGIYISGTSNYINLEYLEIFSNGTEGAAFGIYAIVSVANFYGEISYCKIHDNWGQQIQLTTTARPASAAGYGQLLIHHNDIYNSVADPVQIDLGGVDFYNNLVHGVKPEDQGGNGYWDGMHLYNIYYRIYNNKFYDQTRQDSVSSNSTIRWGEFGNTEITDVGHMQIYNNLIYEPVNPVGSVFRGFELSAGATGVTSVHDILVANNTFYGIPTTAIFLGFNASTGTSGVSNISVMNNLIVDCGEPLSFLTGDQEHPVTYGSYGEAVDVVVDYNLAYASGSPYSTSCALGSYTPVNNPTVYTYVNFVAACSCMAAGSTTNPNITEDYKLQASSTAAIDSGRDLSATLSVITDIDGNTRAGTWDIGAYEYGGAPAVTPKTISGGGISGGAIR